MVGVSIGITGWYGDFDPLLKGENVEAALSLGGAQWWGLKREPGN